MNIFVISIYPFPEGLAPTNRIKAYAKGLIQAGAKVNVVLPFPTDAFVSSPPLGLGIIDGIHYEYTSGVCKSRYKLFRALSIYSGYRKFKGFITSFVSLNKHNKVHKIDTVILSSDSLNLLIFYSLTSKIIGAKFVFIFDEYPIPIRHKLKSKIPLWKEFMYRLVLKNTDAYISISMNLKDYFCKLCNKKAFILSSVTDTDRFSKVKNDCLIEEEYLCYMGNMELSKDNVDLIIKSYANLPLKIQKRYKLYLYGSPSMSNKLKILNLIESLFLQKNVFFKGKVSFEDVPQVLRNATVLLSSQPDTLRAHGGFPTKLGEYLLSGIPTLISDVGENSKFVRDGIEVFFAKPDSIEDYTNKLEYIIENYSDALYVAEQGKQYVKDSFSHIKQGEKLFLFLQSL